MYKKCLFLSEKFHVGSVSSDLRCCSVCTRLPRAANASVPSGCSAELTIIGSGLQGGNREQSQLSAGLPPRYLSRVATPIFRANSDSVREPAPKSAIFVEESSSTELCVSKEPVDGWSSFRSPVSRPSFLSVQRVHLQKGSDSASLSSTSHNERASLGSEPKERASRARA